MTKTEIKIEREAANEFAYLMRLLTHEFGASAMRTADLRAIREVILGAMLLGAEIAQDEAARELAKQQHAANTNMIRAALAVAKMRAEGEVR